MKQLKSLLRLLCLVIALCVVIGCTDATPESNITPTPVLLENYQYPSFLDTLYGLTLGYPEFWLIETGEIRAPGTRFHGAPTLTIHPKEDNTVGFPSELYIFLTTVEQAGTANAERMLSGYTYLPANFPSVYDPETILNVDLTEEQAVATWGDYSVATVGVQVTLRESGAEIVTNRYVTVIIDPVGGNILFAEAKSALTSPEWDDFLKTTQTILTTLRFTGPAE